MRQLWSVSHWCQPWCYLLVRRYAKLFFFWSEDLEESWIFFGGSDRWNRRIYLRSKCGDQRHPEEMEVRGLSITVPKRWWRAVGHQRCRYSTAVALQACRRTNHNQFIPSWLTEDWIFNYTQASFEGTRVNPKDPFFPLVLSKTLSLRHLLLWPEHPV